MLYVSLIANLVLAAALGWCWLRNRDQKGDAERTSREFELMLQVQQAEQRTELLQAHALLMQARQQLRQLENADSCVRARDMSAELEAMSA